MLLAGSLLQQMFVNKQKFNCASMAFHYLELKNTTKYFTFI